MNSSIFSSFGDLNMTPEQFTNKGYQVENITHHSKGAGDLIVRKHNKPKYLIEVKQINQRESNGRRGRIQINKVEHQNMKRHAKQLGVVPVYATLIKTPRSGDKIHFLSHDTITSEIKNHSHTEVKISHKIIKQKGRRNVYA